MYSAQTFCNLAIKPFSTILHELKGEKQKQIKYRYREIDLGVDIYSVISHLTLS